MTTARTHAAATPSADTAPTRQWHVARKAVIPAFLPFGPVISNDVRSGAMRAHHCAAAIGRHSTAGAPLRSPAGSLRAWRVRSGHRSEPIPIGTASARALLLMDLTLEDRKTRVWNTASPRGRIRACSCARRHPRGPPFGRGRAGEPACKIGDRDRGRPFASRDFQEPSVPFQNFFPSNKRVHDHGR